MVLTIKSQIFPTVHRPHGIVSAAGRTPPASPVRRVQYECLLYTVFELHPGERVCNKCSNSVNRLSARVGCLTVNYRIHLNKLLRHCSHSYRYMTLRAVVVNSVKSSRLQVARKTFQTTHVQKPYLPLLTDMSRASCAQLLRSKEKIPIDQKRLNTINRILKSSLRQW